MTLSIKVYCTPEKVKHYLRTPDRDFSKLDRAAGIAAEIVNDEDFWGTARTALQSLEEESNHPYGLATIHTTKLETKDEDEVLKRMEALAKVVSQYLYINCQLEDPDEGLRNLYRDGRVLDLSSAPWQSFEEQMEKAHAAVRLTQLRRKKEMIEEDIEDYEERLRGDSDD